MKEVKLGRRTERRIPLSDSFLNPELLYVPGELDKFLVGLATQPRQQFDNIITEEVTNHLFQARGQGFGMDLVSLNLQRGRDHGLPGYTHFREVCGLGSASSFSALVTSSRGRSWRGCSCSTRTWRTWTCSSRG